VFRSITAGPRRRHVRLLISLACTAALVLDACGGADHHHARPTANRTAPIVAESPAPPVQSGVLIVPNGPVGALMRHVLPDAQAIVAVDLKATRAQLGLRAEAIPYDATPAAQPSAAKQLGALTAFVVPREAGAALLAGVDFGHVRAIVSFSGPSGTGLLLRVEGRRRAVATRLRQAGWIPLDGGYARSSNGSLAAARLRLFPGGIVLGIPAQAAAQAAAQRAIPADDRPLVSLFGSYPAPAAFAELGSADSCVKSVVAMEELVPHDASVSITVRGRPSLGRVLLRHGSAALRRSGLLAQPAMISGSMVNVPVVPRPGGPAALGAIVGALQRVTPYRCA
jgi:hypothetical protein